LHGERDAEVSFHAFQLQPTGEKISKALVSN
jgi:hypothetical protein